MSYSNSEKGVLVVNLGSPDSYQVPDVKKYLDEFLMDERVIDLPLWLRKLVVRGIVLRTRPPKSAAVYKKIWWDEGSPLIVISQRFQKKLADKVPYPVGLGMRYGTPSIKDGFEELLKQAPNLKEVLLVPLYPHYAMASYETVVVKAEEVQQEFFPEINLKTLTPFYDDEKYIQVLGDSMKEHIDPNFDYLLFSYHGIPERHIRKGDSTKKHCLKVENCCQVDCTVAQDVCYRHQVIKTTDMVADYLSIPKEKYGFSFQSRLGPDAWLKPFTAKMFEELPEKGVKNLAVACPAFVADCLETIEEIGMEGKEDFLEAGGEKFKMIPCLNDLDPWIEYMAESIQNSIEDSSVHA